MADQTFVLTIRDGSGGGGAAADASGGGGGGGGNRKKQPSKNKGKQQQAVYQPPQKQQQQPQQKQQQQKQKQQNMQQKQQKQRPSSAAAGQQKKKQTAVPPPLTPDALRRVAKQIEFYFSDSNLARDAFLRKQLAADPTSEGWVELGLIASFAKIRALTTSTDSVAEAISEKSKVLLLSDDRTKLRRVEPLPAGLLSEAAAKPALTVEQKVSRLERLAAVVAEQHIGVAGQELPAASKVAGFSPFVQVGSLKFFLRRLAQLGLFGALKNEAGGGGGGGGGEPGWMPRLCQMIGQAAGWLGSIRSLDQLEELSATANTLGTTLIFARHDLTGIRVPQPSKDLFRQAISHVDRSRNQLRQDLQKRRVSNLNEAPVLKHLEDAAALSASVAVLVEAQSPPPSEAAGKAALQGWLTARLNSRFPGCSLLAYGSSASGLGLAGADLDVCLSLAAGPERDACRGFIDAEAAGLFGLGAGSAAVAAAAAEAQLESALSMLSLEGGSDSPMPEAEPEPEPEGAEGEPEGAEGAEVFEDETRAWRATAARQVVKAVGELLRPSCRSYVISVEAGSPEVGAHTCKPLPLTPAHRMPLGAIEGMLCWLQD